MVTAVNVGASSAGTLWGALWNHPQNRSLLPLDQGVLMYHSPPHGSRGSPSCLVCLPQKGERMPAGVATDFQGNSQMCGTQLRCHTSGLAQSKKVGEKRWAAAQRKFYMRCNSFNGKEMRMISVPQEEEQGKLGRWDGHWFAHKAGFTLMNYYSTEWDALAAPMNVKERSSCFPSSASYLQE